MSTAVTFTVRFEAPFWVGVLEVAEAGEMRATRHVFGSEPTDAELYQFLLRHGRELLERAHANPAAPMENRPSARPNLKRAVRPASREAALVARGRRSTASQEALRLELEQRKERATSQSKQRREDAAEHSTPWNVPSAGGAGAAGEPASAGLPADGTGGA